MKGKVDIRARHSLIWIFIALAIFLVLVYRVSPEYLGIVIEAVSQGFPLENIGIFIDYFLIIAVMLSLYLVTQAWVAAAPFGWNLPGKRGLPPSDQIIFKIFSKFRRTFPNAIGSWLFLHTLAGVSIGATFITVLLALLGTEPIVVVTGLYASTLFLYRLFEADVPILRVSEGGSAVDQPPEGHRLRCDLAKVQAVDIENNGGAKAKDVEVRFQLFDTWGYPVTGREKAHQTKGGSLTIEPDDSEKELPLYLLDSEQIQEPGYTLVVNANPTGYFGLFGNTEFIDLKVDEDE